MNMLSGICVFIAIISIIVLILLVFYPYMPWLFDRKSWKIWRKCYKNDNVNKRYSCDLGESYVWPELGYEAVVFKSPGFESGYECALFDISDGKLVFSSFYTMHSVKMTVKLKNTHA